MKKSLLPLFLLVSLLGWYGLSNSEAVGIIYEFGMVFDIQGIVEIRNADSKINVLKREKDILHPIKEGDTIEVKGNGVVIIVSLAENKGYKVLSNSIAIVKNRKLVAVKGTTHSIDGLYPPKENRLRIGGGIVLREKGPCVKAISPLNTVVLDLSPEFKWKNDCQESKKVVIKIVSKEEPVFIVESEGVSFKVPDGLLKYNEEYRWIIESSATNDIDGGKISIPKEAEVKRIKEGIAMYKKQSHDLSQRLSYIFFLLDNELEDLAGAEIAVLKAEFPENKTINHW